MAVTVRTRKLLTLIVAILGLSVVIIDGTAVGVALPAIEEDLNATLADQQWIANSYLLALAALLLVGGSLGDLYGRRRVFTIGLIGFGVTSLLCGLAPNVELLIAFRALQGAAGALLVPGTLSLISAAFDPDERGQAIGQWAAWSGLTGALGPIVGGALVDGLSWRWVFFINVPVILATVALTVRYVAESRDPTAQRGLDVPGVILAAVGLGGVTYALIASPADGWGDSLVLGALALGVAGLVAFLVAEARSGHPLMPLGYFRQGNFAAANAATLAVYAALSGAFFFVPIFLIGTAGYSALEAGFVLLPITLVMLVVSPRAGRWGDRYGPRWFMAGGPAIAAAGLLLLARLDENTNYLTDLLPGLLIFGLGLSLTVAPLTTTVMGSVEASHAGVASGINNMLSRVGGLLGIAVLGTLLAFRFERELDHSAPPDIAAGASVDVGAIDVQNGSASGFSAAVAEARDRPLAEPDTAGLSAPVADAVQIVVHDASVSAFRLSVVAAAALALVGGIISAIWIRNPERVKLGISEVCRACSRTGVVPVPPKAEPEESR